MKQKTTVQRIITSIEEILSGKFSTRVKTSQTDELSGVVQAVNALADRYQMAHETIKLLDEQVKRSNLHTIMALVEALNAKDPYTRGHSERVTTYSMLLAKALNLSDEEIDSIYIASFLHDIGKIGIHDNILNKPASLTSEEYELVKSHANISSQIVSHLPNLSHIAPAVRHHHERHDGYGYPDGLSGESIPLGARILSIADAFDAMTSTRSYRSAFTPQQALNEIKQCAGQQFDPELAQIFVDAYNKTHGGRLPNKRAS
ncbi:MAG TPA: HD-GYP domain-containing protein [Candidatus Aquicultor sp.]|jgi:HD-GYP domain-containing protein (c-di-GMP phosphodiesterase class II)